MTDLSFDDIQAIIVKFKSLNKTMHYTLMKETEEFGMSPEQTRLLLILKSHQNITQKVLAKKLNITKATLSVRLQRLERMGYVSKTQDKKDKRNYIINITENGEIFFQAATKVMQKKAMSIFDGVSKEQIMVINDVIDIMKKNIERCKGEQ